MKLNQKQKEEILERRVVEIIKKESLVKKLKSGKKLIIKHGIDPTASDLHLGQSINYIKMRQFQDLGHKIIFLIGDFTALIGDPSDRSEMRPLLSKDEIEKNTNNVLKQVGVILDLSKTEIRKNSEWYNKMNIEQFLKLASYHTYQQLIEREMFQNRIKSEKPIFIHELLYPILQAYDSVVLKSDLTVIGTDQLFNEMQARSLQQAFGQPPQDILTVPLLIGTDGIQKMSQSLNNYIGITQPANEMYAKVMSIPDSLIIDYYTLITSSSLSKIREIQKELVEGKQNPFIIKKKLAYEIVSTFDNQNLASQAQSHFELVFEKKQLPKDVKTYQLGRDKAKIIDLLVESLLTPSRQGAKRLLKQNAIEIDGQVVKDGSTVVDISNRPIVKVGKKNFLQIIP